MQQQLQQQGADLGGMQRAGLRGLQLDSDLGWRPLGPTCFVAALLTARSAACDTGRSKGWGIVEYETPEEVRRKGGCVLHACPWNSMVRRAGCCSPVLSAQHMAEATSNGSAALLEPCCMRCRR